MAKLSKRLQAFAKKVDRQKLYAIDEALSLVKECASAKFDESIDVAVQLGIDAKKSAHPPVLNDSCHIQMASRSTSPRPSLINSLERNGSWTTRLDDQFIDEEKLPLRLSRIYRDRVEVSWHLSQYVIANAPRPLTEVRF
jgi:hypothetical protein